MAISTKKGISDNPLVELLGQLPYAVYKPLNRAIRTDLQSIGMNRHYQYCVLRDNWKLGETHVACAKVLMKHLNLPLEFFTEGDPDRLKEYIFTTVNHLSRFD